jgi:uncharacterized tellurite resistance protein B-like protein
MPFKALISWLGVEEAAAPEHTPLRDLIDSLDRLEPDRARHLARFAYLLGRVALADRHASDQEVRAMEALVIEQAQLTPEQATVVVGLARTSNLLFGGTADYDVAREFAAATDYDEKLALARCLFMVASSDQAISLPEESEIHRIVNQLKILPQDLVKLRVVHRRFLPGRGKAPDPPAE